ncbi:hypothetical protein [Streptomyces gobiensis]|uniref:hypothetical protein n=1 Tax=Streptomyces gobiensis TaxID=2875706 RepID=UPI001E506D4B|nr:hypothetical protein [Streptomyces gobiensis]UGY95330.1 hypothetical protein test1122_20065 [Streptomyces gobiensis]
MIMRNIANPERTTLAHLTDAEELTAEQQEHDAELPPVTANPRRTTLMEAPAPS